jgi:hypothetical protein
MMRNLDPRSVIIGVLIAIIGFLVMGATSNKGFDTITVNNIKMGKAGLIKFVDPDGYMIGLISSSPLNAHGARFGLYFKGKEAVALDATLSRNGSFIAYNKYGRRSVSIGARLDGSSYAQFYDINGNIIN